MFPVTARDLRFKIGNILTLISNNNIVFKNWRLHHFFNNATNVLENSILIFVC